MVLNGFLSFFFLLFFSFLFFIVGPKSTSLFFAHEYQNSHQAPFTPAVTAGEYVHFSVKTVRFFVNFILDPDVGQIVW